MQRSRNLNEVSCRINSSFAIEGMNLGSSPPKKKP